MIKNMMQVAKSYILSSMRSDSEYKKKIHISKGNIFFSSVIINKWKYLITETSTKLGMTGGRKRGIKLQISVGYTDDSSSKPKNNHLKCEKRP